jgi:hypothetical protein
MMLTRAQPLCKGVNADGADDGSSEIARLPHPTDGAKAWKTTKSLVGKT